MKMGTTPLCLHRGMGAGMGSPASPSPQSHTTYPTTLHHSPLVSSQPWDWMWSFCKTVDEWDNSPSYEAAKAAVKSLPVVNDGAERGVKITSEFLESARKEETFQTRLQVAENDRKAVPNQRKRHIRLLK